MKTYDKFLDYYDQIVRWINSPIDEETDFLGIDKTWLQLYLTWYKWKNAWKSEAKFKKFRKKIDFVRYDEF